MHGSSTLPKSERLQRGHQFRHAYEHGRKFVGKLFVLYVVDDPPGDQATGRRRALGVVTSRKIGDAVTRNRARRLLREAYRLNKQKLKTNLQMVMIARSAINGKRLPGRGGGIAATVPRGGHPQRDVIKRLLLLLLRLYRCLSPLKMLLPAPPLTGGCCRFYPTCSCYAREAVEKHGPVRGLWLTIETARPVPSVQRRRI